MGVNFCGRGQNKIFVHRVRIGRFECERQKNQYHLHYEMYTVKNKMRLYERQAASFVRPSHTNAADELVHNIVKLLLLTVCKYCTTTVAKTETLLLKKKKKKYTTDGISCAAAPRLAQVITIHWHGRQRNDRAEDVRSWNIRARLAHTHTHTHTTGGA